MLSYDHFLLIPIAVKTTLIVLVLIQVLYIKEDDQETKIKKPYTKSNIFQDTYQINTWSTSSGNDLSINGRSTYGIVITKTIQLYY